MGVVVMRRGHFVPGVWCDQCPLNLAKANPGDWVSVQGEKQKDQSHHATGPGTDQSRVSMQISQGLWGGASPSGCPYRIRGLSTNVQRLDIIEVSFPRRFVK